MFMGKKILGLVAIIACGFGSQAFAADQGCIVLTSVAEVEQDVVDAKGVKSKKLVPVAKAVPGVEVIWTVTANNICKAPSEKVTINLPVPEHMTFVANSATGAGSDISAASVLQGKNPQFEGGRTQKGPNREVGA